MEVILINPSFDRSTMGPFHEYVPKMLPLSIGFLAGYLLARDIVPNIVDEQLEYITHKEVEMLVSDKGRIIVGLSCLTAGAARAYELASWIKEANPEAILIYGGIHATVLPEEALKRGRADIVVRNEGEEAIYELIQYYRQGGKLENIKGISFACNGKFIHNPPRPLIEDLNSLPPFPYHLFEKDIKKYIFGDIMMSRGCPFECIFCSQRSISGRAYRFRSTGNIIKELDALVYKYGQKQIIFNDDNFVVNRNHVFELCDKIIARKYPDSLSFQVYARGDMVDLEMLRLMKRAGIGAIVYGLETGSERLMKIVKKRLTVADNKRAIELTHEAGILTNGSFILGLPTETKEESLQTIRFAKSIPLDLTRFNLLVPYPGTEVYELLKKSRQDINDDWSSFLTVSGFGTTSIPYIPEGRIENEMRRLQLWANLTFYLRPRQFIILMRKKFSNQLHLPSPLTLRGMQAYMKIAIYLIITITKTFIKNKVTNDGHLKYT